MRYLSTNGRSAPVGVAEAVLSGLAPDGGLYMPESIPLLPPETIRDLPSRSLPEIASTVISPFVAPDIPAGTLREVAESAFDFPAPLVELDGSTAVLELFHGPTFAFKDFGARFMARLFSKLPRPDDKEIVVLAATSGDTGSAVARGFFGLPGFRVVVLYPSGQVSPLQEKQLTTIGGNVTALEVLGTFDECQTLVKRAFVDPDLRNGLRLTSANSINIARLLPQSLYYFVAASFAEPGKRFAISVPSGNFGNLTAGLLAKRMGLGVDLFIASTNANAVVPRYLEGADMTPTASVRTLSNAMDVGDPSNFARMLALYPEGRSQLGSDVVGCSFSDEETLDAMREVDSKLGYCMDPHTAVGYLGQARWADRAERRVVLGTAHPAKFGETVLKALGRQPELPEALAEALRRPKLASKLAPSLEALKEALL